MSAVVPEHFEALFDDALATARQQDEPAWMLDRRQQAFARLKHDGFPTIRHEEWKYTNLRSLLEHEFSLAQGPLPAGRVGGERRDDEAEIIFIDGVFAPEQSRREGLDGVDVTSFQNALSNGGARDLQDRLEGIQVPDGDPFALLNQAFCSGGVVIRIAEGVVVAKRLQLLFLTTGMVPNILVTPRVFIDVGVSSTARLTQSHTGHPDATSLTAAVTDIHVSANASLSFSKIQSEGPAAYHMGTVRSTQAADSHLSLFDFSAGGRMARNNLTATLDGEGAEVHMNGLYAVRGKQHVDNHTTIDHRKPRCVSRQTYKGILDERAHAVFNGKVFVRAGAKLTDGYQLNRNLLLSRSAKVDTKPQLEIDNDDVKCSHGATIGQIDEDQLFYLLSRGIGKDEAIAMLSRGFVEDVLYLIKDKSCMDYWIPISDARL